MSAFATSRRRALLAAGDGARVKRIAHTLKGLFATFCAAPAEAAALQLELSARDGDLAACGELAPSIRAHTDGLAVALKA